MALYLYKLVPASGDTRIRDEPVVEQTISSPEQYGIGDVVPAEPGTWIVERIDGSGITQWASEAVSRIDPQTKTPITLYCRVSKDEPAQAT